MWRSAGSTFGWCPHLFKDDYYRPRMPMLTHTVSTAATGPFSSSFVTIGGRDAFHPQRKSRLMHELEASRPSHQQSRNKTTNAPHAEHNVMATCACVGKSSLLRLPDAKGPLDLDERPFISMAGKPLVQTITNVKPLEPAGVRFRL